MLVEERTTVGLDVHARSVVAEAVDWSSGETFSRWLTPAPAEVLAWVSQLPGTVAVTYEAGPTGFGLARAFAAAGIRCEVVAPSKLQRPPGDRVKTDRRDARRLARLLHIGEIGGIRVPTVMEEDARDLVRARDQARSDLMRARNRLSKLLLRHGIVYCGGSTWNGVHERWLRTQRFDLPGARAAFDEAFDTVLDRLGGHRPTCSPRCRDHRDGCPTTVGAHGGPSGGDPGNLHPDRAGTDRGDRRLAPVHRRQHRRLPRPSPHRVLQRHDPGPGSDHQDRPVGDTRSGTGSTRNDP